MSVTRNDVARAAGVSSAVVSYVVNDGPRPVSADARRRVLDAIERLGYRRDRLARAMRTGTTDSIGLVLPDISLAYFAAVTHQITEVAGASGLSVVVATSNGAVDSERRHVMDLADRQVDGVILMSVDPLQELDWARDLGVPVIVVDRPLVATGSARAAADHLLADGVQRIARISGPEETALTRRRDLGWKEALERSPFDADAEPVWRSDVTERGGYEAFTSLIAAHSDVDGIVIDSGPQAVGALRAAGDLGVLIPDRLKVIALEAGPQSEYLRPRLSSVDSPLEELANAAVEFLLADGLASGLHTLSGTRFVLTERESCGHPPARHLLS